jgi:hypothetical protein
MRNPKQLAQAAVVESLRASGVEVDASLEELVEDLINEQWNSRNRERFAGKDEASLMKLVRDYIARTSEGNKN